MIPTEHTHTGGAMDGITLDASGPRGQDGVNGISFTGSASTGDNGNSGTAASYGTPGMNAGNIDVLIQCPATQRCNPAGELPVTLQGTTFHWNGQVQPVASAHTLQLGQAIHLVVRGGDGGHGANGGHGQDGGHGCR